MARYFLILAAALALSSCVGWSQRIAAGECTKYGIGTDHPSHSSCVQSTLAHMETEREQETENLLGLFAVGAAVYGASQPTYAVTGQSVAPLVGQYVNGPQRICTYQTSTAQVQTTTPVSLSCPASLNY